MKTQIIISCTFLLLAATACNKSEMSGPCGNSGFPCTETSQAHDLNTGKPQHAERITDTAHILPSRKPFSHINR